jgi:two-component system, sensor histidine kinase and response regulator
MTVKSSEKKKQPLVLIAEDIPKNMEIVCNILRKEGYRLAMAGNGRQALEMVPNVQPDLILLDIMMPELNGFDVCKQLKENPETKDIPIIFLTAKAESEDIVKGLQIGAVDYVTKPFRGTELVSRVKTHLELKFSRQQLKELNTTKDKFFSIVAHDLKDPLNYLLLSSGLLHQQYDTLDEDKRKDYIHRFYNNVNLLQELLNNLLVWARSQTGSLKVEPQTIDIHNLAEECVALLNENARKKEIALSNRIPPNTFGFADKNMILTVLRNLISNSLKFTHQGGEVTLSVSSNPDSPKLAITVTDNGVGMSPEELAQLFRIDIKRSTKGTNKERGTGLGLLLCKEFIEKNNGSIEIASESGSGSRFTFTLPKPPRYT